MVNLAGNYAHGQILTPWIDVPGGNACSSSLFATWGSPWGYYSFHKARAEFREHKVLSPSHISHPGHISIDGVSHLLYVHPSYPWFAVVGRVMSEGAGGFVALQNVNGTTGKQDTWDNLPVGDFPFSTLDWFQLALVRFGSAPIPSQIPAMNHEFMISRFFSSQIIITYDVASGWAYEDFTIPISYPEGYKALSFRVNFQFIPGTCPTPTVSGGNTRTLAPVRWDELSAVGSVAKQQDFNLQFSNCSSHLSKISYKIDPVGGNSPNAGQGLLPLRAPSTAQGLAIQVLERRQSDNAWVVSSLGQWRERNASGGGHTLPMAVRYYRTGNLVGGNVNAAMTISFQYQ